MNLGNRYKIVCGEYDSTKDEGTELEFDVTSVIPHPKYTRADKGYDIAVYKVNSSNHLLECAGLRPAPLHFYLSHDILQLLYHAHQCTCKEPRT